MLRIFVTLWRLFLGEMSVELVREEQGQSEDQSRDNDPEENIIHCRSSFR
jgi:hypothetical protein